MSHICTLLSYVIVKLLLQEQIPLYEPKPFLTIKNLLCF